MKKINKLLIGLTAISSAVIPVAAISSCSCNNGGYDITPTGDAKVKSQEIDSNGNLVITLEPTKSSESITGVEQVKIGDKTLTENTDYTFSNGKLTIKKAALEANKGKITFKVKTGSEEEMTQEKWENIFGEIDYLGSDNTNFTATYGSGEGTTIVKNVDNKFYSCKEEGDPVYYGKKYGQLLKLEETATVGTYTYKVSSESPLAIFDQQISSIRKTTDHTYNASTGKYEGTIKFMGYDLKFYVTIKNDHIQDLRVVFEIEGMDVTLNYSNVGTTTLESEEYPTSIQDNVIQATLSGDTWTADIGDFKNDDVKICIFNLKDGLKSKNKIKLYNVTTADLATVDGFILKQQIDSEIELTWSDTQNASIPDGKLDSSKPLCCQLTGTTTAFTKSAVKVELTTSD